MFFHTGLIAFVVTLTSTNCARILSMVSTPCYSHQAAFRALWRELSLRGHTLTVLTTDPVNDPTLTNIKEIDMGISYNQWNQWNANSKASFNYFQMFSSFYSVISIIGEEQLLLPEVQDIITNATEHFDVVMVEPFFLPSAVFSERFNCPIIQLFSLDSIPSYYFALANPSHPSLYPHYALPFVEPLNFFERFTSAINAAVMTYLLYYVATPRQDVLVKKYFEISNLRLEEILKKTSMKFVNTEIFLHSVRPLIPNVIQFGGGSHFVPPKSIPKNLQAQLDNARNGFIYFSLGTTIRSERLPEATIKFLLEIFSELPYTVLWKFERGYLPDKPKNVIISKWLPQHDILRHPNIKLFIYQGGLQSGEEAFYSNVPVLGIPFFIEQQHNMKRLIKRGLALAWDLTTMNKTTFKACIREVLNNPAYRNKIQQLSEIVRDQHMTGLESAIWWTEYVIRHNGTLRSRSEAMELPGYQYLLLDVIGFLLMLLTTLICTIFKVARLTWGLTGPRHTSDKSSLTADY